MGLDFRILGELEVRHDGDPVELGSPSQRALLARLLISPGEVVATERLVEDLWQGDLPKTARHIVQVYVSELRNAFGNERDRFEFQGAGYRICVEPDELDAFRFEQLATKGRAALARRDAETASIQLREALDLWRGPAFGTFANEAFAREESARFDQLRLSTLEQRVWADLEIGRHGEVVEELQHLVAQHPFRETLWEQLMLALYRSGRQADALRVYQTARARLAEELGIEPGPALRLMEDRILAQDPNLEPAVGAVADRPPNELPPERTTFVGRERELVRGADLLERSRLLTLTGAPGSGKSRLALRLAANHLGEYPHGSFFVPLAAVTNPRFMGNAVARVLGLRDLPGETALEAISAFLRSRRALLILDNFEQILRAAPQVGTLLDAAPGLTIMVTSRAPLGLVGEQELPVPPLDVPPVGKPLDLEAVTGYDAVALFLVRARAVDPNFNLNSDNAAAVAEITARLDGLPLAIELAAARVRLLPPQDLLARLEERLAVLTGGPTNAESRHRTLRDAIAWSYDLLEPEEQTLFRRLGILRGFNLEAATAVTGLSEAEVFDGVDSLLSRSLVYKLDAFGEARFAQLETIREFALEELVSAGEVEEVERRHAEHFCRFAQAVEPRLTQETQHAAIELLLQEQENIRRAIRFAVDAGDPDLGLLLTGCIWRFWQSSEQLTEGRQWLESLLAYPEASAEARVKGLTGLAGLAYWQADYDEAWARYSEALELYKAMGDRFNQADTLYSMSMTASWNEDPDSGARLAEEAHLLFDELGSREGIGRTLLARGFSLWKGNDLPAALRLYEEGLAIARESHDPAMAASLLVGVAALTFHLGDRERALRIMVETVEEATELRNTHLAVWALDLTAAFSASVAPEAAARLGGAVESLRQRAGGGMLPESLGVEDARSVARRLLSAEVLRQAWAEGHAMSLEEALALAHQLEALASGHQPTRRERPEGTGVNGVGAHKGSPLM